MKEIKTKKDDVALYRNEAFDYGFYDYFKNKTRNKISEVLNNRERNIKFEKISYRELNSWEQAQLFTIEREGREWRRFSIIDAIWIKTIKELREFGMSWEQLKVTKESLEFAGKKCGVSMPLLEFYTAFVIAQKMPVILLVFKDGIAIPVSLTQYKAAKESIGIANHIQINLNDLIQGMVPELDLKPVHKSLMPLDVDEMELLAFLRLEQFETVEIFYKNGKMETVQGMERIKVNALLTEVIKEHQYQKIEVIVQDGEKISLRRTVKKQINKKG